MTLKQKENNMSQFCEFRQQLNKQLDHLTQKDSVFRADVSKDEMWSTYLSSFAEGTDPIYKTNTQHDCNCCRQFIRDCGNLVIIEDNK